MTARTGPILWAVVFALGFGVATAVLRVLEPAPPAPRLVLSTTPIGVSVFLVPSPNERMFLGVTPFDGFVPIPKGSTAAPIELVATGWRRQVLRVPLAAEGASVHVDMERSHGTAPGP